MSRKNWRHKKRKRIEAAKPAAADRPKLGEFRLCGTGAPVAIRAEAGEDGKPKLPTFTGNAYTGAPMRPEGWYRPVVVDLAGVRVPSQHRPILRQHDHNRIVGHSTEVAVDAEGIKVAGVLSGTGPHVDEVRHLAGNGFQWQLSIGADPVRTEELDAGKETEVNGRTVTGPLTISRETVIGEISFVPLGADGDTSAAVSASRGGRSMFKKLLKAAKVAGNIVAQKYSDDDIEKMDEKEAKAALKKCMAAEEKPETEGDDEPPAKAKKAKAADDDGDEDKKAEAAAQKRIQAARKAEADEARRVSGIRARVQKYGGINSVKVKVDAAGLPADDGAERTVDLVAHAIEFGWSADQAELVALRCGRPGPGTGGPLVYATGTPEASEAVIEAAILDAAKHQFKLEDDDFYLDRTPDGKGTVRRVPLSLQREAQSDFRAGGRYTDQVRQAAHTLFRGRIGLHQVIHGAFSRWGYRHQLDLSGEHGVRDMLRAWGHFEEQRRIHGEGASDLSISNILSNVQNKFALQGYLFTEQAWREFCALRNVKDFKPTKSINLLGDIIFKVLGPTGELENASFGDQAFANQAAPFGRIATIPWTHIVNDDLSMLTGVPQKIGQGAGLAVNDQVWTLMKTMAAGTVNGDDGNPFWRTTSSTTAAAMKAGTAYKPNKFTGGGSAFGAAGLKQAKAAFDNQIDPNGNPLGFDGLTPILLHGPTLWADVATQLQAPGIVYGGATAALQPNFNPWQGMLKPVMSRYVENANYVNSTTAWWVLFNPVALAVLEVCFLNGVDTPAVLQAGPDFQFDRLGISIRGTMPFGSNQQNFRGGVYNAGA